VPSEGTVFLQSSSNLTSWSTVATNADPAGNPFAYAFPMTNKPGGYYRATQVP